MELRRGSPEDERAWRVLMEVGEGCFQRCAGLKLQGETKALFLSEENEKMDSDILICHPNLDYDATD
ncbi:hypothetical protein RHSIM_Rhsim07G0064400 [Rhododendron simsii]|uniref:Uncharacterized protein n=1 Tax=Rhododendron simsii TaxID=118357 RepID=A0A834GKY7_RHOSS|nr:hypothetical protein RHSIM_Rhsim07G0064400 [Rhododendron simsii]